MIMARIRMLAIVLIVTPLVWAACSSCGASLAPEDALPGGLPPPQQSSPLSPSNSTDKSTPASASSPDPTAKPPGSPVPTSAASLPPLAQTPPPHAHLRDLILTQGDIEDSQSWAGPSFLTLGTPSRLDVTGELGPRCSVDCAKAVWTSDVAHKLTLTLIRFPNPDLARDSVLQLWEDYSSPGAASDYYAKTCDDPHSLGVEAGIIGLPDIAFELQTLDRSRVTVAAATHEGSLLVLVDNRYPEDWEHYLDCGMYLWLIDLQLHKLRTVGYGFE